MKKELLFLITCFFATTTFAQQLDDVATETQSGWYKFKPETQVSISQFLQNYHQILDLESEYSFDTGKLAVDEFGFSHLRLQQLYKDIPIEAGDFLLHERSLRLSSMNGKLVRNINLSITPSLSKKGAIKRALNHVNAQKYIWENESDENIIKDLHHNPDATYYPQPELIIAQKDFNQNGADYRLMYKMNVYALEPLSRQEIYVDAHTGEVIFALDEIHTGDVPGVAHTKYTGVQNIVTDSISPELYRLRESTTGGGIETYDLLRTRDYSVAVDFIDSNNVWDNVNAFQDEVATDAHWGAQTTYNYFFDKHGRSSYDGKGTKLLNYVHYGVSYANAFWDGQRMTYGDGNGSSFNALISLDIAAHEMTHGVTQNTAGLVYQDEYGALNESFSDIFAAAVEYYGDPANFDYRVGEDITTNGQGIRSMSNPGTMGDPDTYLAGLWYTGAFDNGGVHINSGVQNYWFYIMAEGDSGTNALGIAYNVPGLGIEKAAQISYRNLAYYLTRTSEYFDARAGAIQAAEDIYGVCSNELITTADAWHAVGVGKQLQDDDVILVDVLSPQTSCGLGSTEAITVLVRYYDCSDTLFAGDSISFGYQLDNLNSVTQTAILTQDMVAGDTLIFTFNQTADFSAFTDFYLKTWINYSPDQDADNDTIQNTKITNRLQQNSDFAIVDLLSPQSDCELTSAEPIEMSFRFQGCDSLVAGQTIQLYYQLNGQAAVSENLTSNSTIYPGEEITYIFSNSIDLSLNGQYAFNLWVAYPSDPEDANDSIINRSIQNPFNIREKHHYTFEDSNTTLDSLYFSTTSYSNIDFFSDAAVSDTLGLRFTGSNPFPTLGDVPVFNRSNPWSINPEFSSMACACVDARDWDSVLVAFDLKQTYSRLWRIVLGRDQKVVSSFRVLADGNQIGDDFQPITNANDRFRSYLLNLRDYAHTEFQLCLEAKNYLSEEFDPRPNSEGDNAYIDNLIIYNNGNIGLNELSQTNKQWVIYPNPTQGRFTMSFEVENTLSSSYQIYNANSLLLADEKLDLNHGENQVEIDLSSYPTGVYFIKMNGAAKKVLIER